MEPATPSNAAPPRGVVYIIEGEIAAGKTELATAIAEALTRRGLRVCLVLEPVELWQRMGILKKFYADPGRFGYAFQTYVYATRVQAIVDQFEADPEADVYLLERSPATDKLFMYAQSHLVDPVEVDMYDTWCRVWELSLPEALKRARVLYLRTDLDRCMQRLVSRARGGEVTPQSDEAPPSDEAPQSGEAPPSGEPKSPGGVSAEYQQLLRRLHEAYYLGQHSGAFPRLPPCPFAREVVSVIEPDVANLDYRADSPDRENAIGRVLSVMGFPPA